MKKILSLFILSGLIVFSACDPMEDIYNEIDAQEDPILADIEYTLTSDDYEAIADLIIADNPADSLNAQFIEAFGYFTDDISVQDYVPYYLNDEYPWLGPGSTANITYNYNGDMPEDLTSYVGVDEYEFDEDDYESVDSLVNITGYLYPNFNPNLYLPGILTNSITGAEDGDMYLISYKYSDVNPVINIVNNTKVFEEDFETATAYETIDINGWAQYIEAGTETWEGRSYNGLYAQFSAYGTGEVSNISWLITPAIDLSEYSEVIFNFDSKDGYSNGDPLTVLISTDYTGTGDPNSSTWADLDPILSTGNTSGYASAWVESGDLSLDDYCGGIVYIAFKYEGGDPSLTTTMQINDVTVTALTAGFEVIGPNSYTVKEYYEYDGSEWSKMSDIYYLSSVDYDAMGPGPGKYSNFSADDLPQDYLPKFLDSNYPAAGEGISIIVVYKYYTGTDAGTVTLADEYTYTSGVWESSYNYVVEQTGQFAVSGTSYLWVFDPTETYTMSNSDFQTIVDYVGANISVDYVDSYGTGESYFGAGAYYGNFDLRAGKWDAEVFASWEEAIEEALGTALLPTLYPSATLQVNGVDMYYRVIFATYSGAAADYAMKFQVTKAGPDPEFTLDEGPILQ